MSRWIKFLLALLLGLATGLFYGWVVSPVEFVDTTPEFLSPDYEADYVLMAAEAYAASTDLAPALNALALLSPQPPANIILEALVYAQGAGYAHSDLALMQSLWRALKSVQPGGTP